MIVHGQAVDCPYCGEEIASWTDGDVTGEQAGTLKCMLHRLECGTEEHRERVIMDLDFLYTMLMGLYAATQELEAEL